MKNETLQLPKINAEESIYGSFDNISIEGESAYATGWAFNIHNPEHSPLKVIVTNNRNILGEGFANIEREDVHKHGAPNSKVGFKVHISASGKEKSLQIYILSEGKLILLKEAHLKTPLPNNGLTPKDVETIFKILFNRLPESEEAIAHQLKTHKTKASFLYDMFKSPEFYKNHSDLIRHI